MKDYLKKLISDKEAKLEELRGKIDGAATADEVRSLSSEAEAIRGEISAAKVQLEKVEAEEKEAAKEEARAAFNPSAAMNVVSTATQTQARGAEKDEDVRGTMEYRKAFMEYVQRGTMSDILQFEKRQDATGTASNLGVLIPSTVIQSIMQGVEKVYGQLYSRVRKTNIPGGVKYPIGSFSASFNRITETTISSRQNAGGVTGYIEFSYNIGEIRLARTLLQTVLSVPVFEQEFAKVIVRTYVEAIDKEIMTGTVANNQCEGILTEANKPRTGTSGDSRIAADHIIEFTETDMADWTSWQTKLFAKIPLSMRSLRPEFVMTANTYEANIKTLKDNNNRPLYNETYNPVDGSEICTFKGRQVVLVEDDILGNFNDISVEDESTDSPYFGMYWVPEEAYAINSNMEFSVVDYFDHETNQYVKKALVINDGKVLDPKYIYLLKKVAPEA